MAGSSSELLGCFWSIASLQEKERSDSIKKLVCILHQLKNGESELNYSIQRLVKGTASDRKGARQGFSVALAEVMRLFHEVSPKAVLTAVDKHLVPSGSFKGQEERGCLFGQTFVCLSLIKSARLSWMDCMDVLKRLQTLWTRKSYLKEVCSVAVGNLLEQYKEITVLEDVVSVLSPVLSVEWEGLTCESLYLLLVIQKTFPKDPVICRSIKTNLGHKRVLCKETVKSVSDVLHTSTSCHPRVHSVWSQALDAARRSPELLRVFWELTVEADLMESTDKWRYLAFALLKSLLPSLKAAEASVVLSPNLIKCLISSLSNRQSDLHQAALHLVSITIDTQTP
jgi:DNA polymerase phi